ncbi:uncharacterized protein LOC132263452 [Phlebotomus argentipes]|uniref:uncharacterized protein LOC132263452 n=1 Tax=Phlebotomus argentipes TaxID=94469 RepID=UPI002892D2F3|nr:uncharacterized protein LOC132263452 [Phlebotomus argentipes]
MAPIKWKRSSDVPFPSVWHRFSAKDPKSGETVQFRIQDLPEERYGEAIDMMVEHFLRDEPMCKSRNCVDDPRAIADFRQMWQKVVQDKLCLVCFREDSDEIVGMNFLKVTQKDWEEEPTDYGEACNDILKAMDFIAESGNLYDHYQVDKLISGYGLLVPPQFRGLKLGVELLKARVPLGRAVGLKVTSTVFSNRSSQSAATKAGFEDSFEISWDELQKKGPRMNFPVLGTPTVKLQSMRLD